MKLRLEDLPEPLRREVEDFARRERNRARWEFFGLLVFVLASVLGAASILGILLG